MEKLQRFLDTIKNMPKRSGVLCAAVVIPSGYSESQMGELRKLVDDAGLQRISFSSREELEKVIQASSSDDSLKNSPMICLLTQELFSNGSLSGLVDVVFQF